MTGCYEFEKNISRYLDGDMNDRERLLSEEHCSCCPDCGDKFEQLKSIKTRLASLTVLKTSPNFDIVLRSRLRDELNRQRPLLGLGRLNLGMRLSFYTAAIAVLISTGMVLDRTIANNRSAIPNELQLAATPLRQSPRQSDKTAQPEKTAKRTSFKNYMPPERVGVSAIAVSPANDRSRFAGATRKRAEVYTDRSTQDTLPGITLPSSPLIRQTSANTIVEF